MGAGAERGRGPTRCSAAEGGCCSCSFNLAAVRRLARAGGHCGLVRAALRRPPGEAAGRPSRPPRAKSAQGNYALRVTGRTGPDEIGLLNRALQPHDRVDRAARPTALIGANRQLAERRAFIEAVLQSITAGIVSVDQRRPGRADEQLGAALLLDRAGPAPIGLELAEIAPRRSPPC